MTCIQTYTGKKFFPLDPRTEDIDIVDIAHALSMICRYNGHCKRFYSVAEHCIRGLSLLNGLENKLWFLLHDATQAYLCDLTSPVKKVMPEYRIAENILMTHIAEKFNLPFPMPEAIHDADLMMARCEKEVLMKPCDWKWGEKLEALTPNPSILYGLKTINALDPETAKSMFLRQYEILR